MLSESSKSEYAEIWASSSTYVILDRLDLADWSEPASETDLPRLEFEALDSMGRERKPLEGIFLE